MIGKRIRHFNRYRGIAMALTRHGFGFIVEELDIFHLLSLPGNIRNGTKKDEKTSIGERIRLVVQELGPTFIKLGQIASTRSDLIPESIIKELEKLQDQVTPFSYQEVKHIIESELNIDLDQTFLSFEETPLAAASIGQVHLALLTTGERIAVKVQRPTIAETIRTDLEILQNLAIMAEARFEWAHRHQLVRLFEEFKKSLLDELDYTIEGKNAEKIASQFKNQAHIRIPKVYWEFSSKKILAMEFMDGIKLNSPELLHAKGYDSKRIAERLMNAILHQIFIKGFFHADPHPGNITVLRGEVIAFMDFGLVGRLTPKIKRQLAKLIIALMLQSSEGVIRALLGMGLVTPQVNMTDLRRDVDLLRDKYVGVPFGEMSLGEAVNDLLEVAYRHEVRIPADFVLLGKCLITVEGVVKQLDPKISILQIAEPFGKKLLLERLHPGSILEHVKEEWTQYSDILFEFPNLVKELIPLIKKGQLDVSIPQFDLLLRQLDRISKRISLSMVWLSFCIILTGIMIGSSQSNQPGLLGSIPVLEIGALIAVFILVWFIHSIFKSGRS
ncbi:AarF/ABC1/UbiB kinase family protein [Paenibacillus sp. tmac-D7]|uniref:ABC1 kinase family protein n=1 Tax=Paenibacillus sp. tmac-D7 TaxID=2591462 RepID=UPI00114236A9|nr:AarF/ABC1/UbiB kinase family protein [Paenibacillus sp. tmac-D7]